MKNGYNIVIVSGLLLASYILGFICPSVFADQVKSMSGAIEPQKPRYEIKLNLKEFSVLNSAARLGVAKYGGNADFAVRLANNNNDVVWTVTITNPKLIEMWEYWMAEKTSELVNLLDFDNLDTASKAALETVKSVNAKIAQARANPIWDPVKLSGLVVENDRHWFIQSGDGKYLVTGSKLRDIKPMKDKHVIATGFVKVRDQFELISFIEKKQNTLELFVMSFCPFSKRAELSIIDFLKTFPGNPKPILEVHYIFYKKSEDGKTVFTSLHGEEEIQENLVQMIIRDMYPDFYHEYLLHRAKNDTSWEGLVREVGIAEQEIEMITDIINEGGRALIESEYEYVAGTYQVYDGSPTYVWESERVGDIRKIKAFNNLEFTSDICVEH